MDSNAIWASTEDDIKSLGLTERGDWSLWDGNIILMVHTDQYELPKVVGPGKS